MNKKIAAWGFSDDLGWIWCADSKNHIGFAQSGQVFELWPGDIFFRFCSRGEHFRRNWWGKIRCGIIILIVIMTRSIQVNLFWVIMPKRISKTTKSSKKYYIINIRVLQTPRPSLNSKRFPSCDKWCQQQHYKFLLQLHFIKNMHRPNLWDL